MATIIHFGGYFYPATYHTMNAISLFHDKEIIKTKLTQINQYQAWHEEITKMEKSGKNQFWKAYLNEKDFINISVNSNNPEKLTFEFFDKYDSFRIQRNIELREKDFMSFLKIEDKIEYKKSHLRLLSSIFYNHKKSVKQEMKKFEILLDKQFGVSF
jgi:hypothetical protein